QGHSVSLYGLDRLKEGGDPLFLVEGESDCHTLWFRGRAALGAPGAATFRPARDDVFLEGRRMIALVEPDQGGEALLQRLMQSSHKDRIAAARLSGFKDVSELHIHEPERFDEILNAAVEEAEPLAQVHAAPAARPRRRRAAADEDDKQPTQADRLIGFAESEAMLFKTPRLRVFRPLSFAPCAVGRKSHEILKQGYAFAAPDAAAFLKKREKRYQDSVAFENAIDGLHGVAVEGLLDGALLPKGAFAGARPGDEARQPRQARGHGSVCCGKSMGEPIQQRSQHTGRGLLQLSRE